VSLDALEGDAQIPSVDIYHGFHRAKLQELLAEFLRQLELMQKSLHEEVERRRE